MRRKINRQRLETIRLIGEARCGAMLAQAVSDEQQADAWRDVALALGEAHRQAIRAVREALR